MHNEALLQHLYDLSPMLIGIISIENNDFYYVKANKLTLEFFGKPEHEVVNHFATELGTPRKSIDEWIKHSLESESKNAPVVFEYVRPRPAGTIVFNATAIYLGKGDNGIKYYAYMSEDITERRKAHLENERLLNELNAIMDATTEVSIIGTDLAGTITHFNKGGEKLLGYKSEELVGKHTPRLFHTKKEVADREKATDAVEDDAIKRFEVFTANKTTSNEFTYVRKDGNGVAVQLVVTPKINETGKKVGYLGKAVDISKIKAAEKALEDANKELEAFAYVASHDLQSPLRTISGLVSLLEHKSDEFDENTNKYVGIIKNVAAGMQKLITDILEYSRQSKVELEYEEVDINMIVNHIANIHLATKDTLPPIIKSNGLPTIMAHKLGMQQLFANLIGNGIKYQPADNQPIIQINVEDKKDCWEFSVSDNGIGIDPSNYEKVFTVFKRLHRQEEYAGTGVGLSICQKIVQHHHGKIWIEPSALGGSTFKFTMGKWVIGW